MKFDLLHYLQGESAFAQNLMAPAAGETDPVKQVEAVHGKAKKDFLPGQTVTFGVLAVCLGIFLCLGEAFQPALLLCAALLGLYTAATVARYARWHRQARTAAEQGIFLPFREPRWMQLVWRGLLLLCLVWLLVGLAPEYRFTAGVAVAVSLGYGVVLFVRQRGHAER